MKENFTYGLMRGNDSNDMICTYLGTKQKCSNRAMVKSKSCISFSTLPLFNLYEGVIIRYFPLKCIKLNKYNNPS